MTLGFLHYCANFKADTYYVFIKFFKMLQERRLFCKFYKIDLVSHFHFHFPPRAFMNPLLEAGMNHKVVTKLLISTPLLMPRPLPEPPSPHLLNSVIVWRPWRLPPPWGLSASPCQSDPFLLVTLPAPICISLVAVTFYCCVLLMCVHMS